MKETCANGILKWLQSEADRRNYEQQFRIYERA